MACESNLKHRIIDDTGTVDESSKRDYNMKGKRSDIAKRGLRSLAVAVAFPLSLTLFNIYLFGGGSTSTHSSSYLKLKNKPFWIPPLWLIHTATMASSFIMGLSAWLVWAEGAFHKNPTVLSLYLAQLGFSLAWVTVVFGMGGYWVGLVLCLALFGTLLGCSRLFREVNPIAADMVYPCLASAAFLAVVNLQLLFI